jgi:PAS domain S-box-containing protein
MDVDFIRVVDALPGLVWTAQVDGSIDFVNQRWCEYTGLSKESACGWGWQTAICPDDLPGVLERWRSILASSEPGDFEARLRRFDGEYRHFVIATSALRDATGRIVKWCGVNTDIEERRQAEEALRARDRFRLIVDDLPEMVTLMTPEGEFGDGNRHMLEYFGAPVEELKRRPTTQSFHPDDRPSVDARWKESVETGRPYDFEARLRRADGVYRWFHTRGFPLRDADGRILLWHLLQTDVDERKRAEDGLRESERELRLIVDSIPGLVATLTPAGEVEFVNRQVLEYYGKTLEELAHWETSDATYPEDLPRAVELVTQSIASGDPFTFEVRTRRFDGVYRWFQSRGFPLRDTNGHIVRWYNLLIDIDERKRAEEALAASERNLKLTIDTMPALTWSARPDGTADFFNQHYLEFVGLSAEQAEGWGWTAAVHPDDMNGLADIWQQALISQQRGEAEARLRRHDGEYRWFLFRASPLRDQTGAIVKWYGVNTDIEDRKRAEAELRRAYNSFADAQRLSKTGSFIADLLGDDHTWSDEAYRIFEFEPRTKVTLQRVRDVIHPDDLPAFETVNARAMTGVDVNFAFRIVTSRGAVKHVRGVAHVVERVAGRPMFVGALQDVTETKVAEEALNRAGAELAHVSRVTTLSALTASIAHEVNQPLSGIITNAGTCLRMLDADPPDIEGARETARRTIRDGNRASEVIARLRALFSKREFTLEPVDLNEATREVLALSSNDLQRNRVVLQSELADQLPTVPGDRIQLQQVILNLLRNASDAMMAVHDRPRRLVIRTAPDDGDRVRLSVRDAGVGLPSASLESLFNAFFTTKSGGMGIGLFVSRSIVERHHGRLWAEPNDGGPGATFWVSLPRAPEGLCESEVQVASGAPR